MHYYPEDISQENLKKLMRANVCAECGREVRLFLDADSKIYIACSGGRHEGIAREYTPPIEDYQSNIRREIEMEQTQGRETSRELATIPKQGQLTQPQAERILSLVYPNATKDEILRTAIFCQDFGLHPLANEVYLIPFKGKNVMVVGIPASRKMAHALKGDFSFLDDSPRAANEEEIVKQFGKDSEEADANIISITKLQGVGGNLAIGFGLYPKKDSPYGTDKGNTRRNMANIRSERQAMDRLPGRALPRYEVIDATYAEVPDVGKVDTSTGEIVEEPVEAEFKEVVEKPEPQTEATKSKSSPVVEESNSNPPEPVGGIDLDWLKESAKSIKWTEKTLTTWIAAKFKVKGGLLEDVVAGLSPEQRKDVVKEIQDRVDMA